MSHHGSSYEEVNEIFNEFNKSCAPKNEKTLSEIIADLNDGKKVENNLGATGNFPDGKVINSDNGGINFAMGIHDNSLIMNFGEKPINWIGFTKEETIKMIESLSELVEKLK